MDGLTENEVINHQSQSPLIKSIDKVTPPPLDNQSMSPCQVVHGNKRKLSSSPESVAPKRPAPKSSFLICDILSSSNNNTNNIHNGSHLSAPIGIKRHLIPPTMMMHSLMMPGHHHHHSIISMSDETFEENNGEYWEPIFFIESLWWKMTKIFWKNCNYLITLS